MPINNLYYYYYKQQIIFWGTFICKSGCAGVSASAAS